MFKTLADSLKEGGPAFPGKVLNQSFSGMTMRDYFAAEAMRAIIQRYEGLGFGGNASSPEFAEVAEQCYFMAEAMLEARK